MTNVFLVTHCKNMSIIQISKLNLDSALSSGLLLDLSNKYSACLAGAGIAFVAGCLLSTKWRNEDDDVRG